MGIGSVGATVFFQVGLCTLLRIMFVATLKLKLQTGAEKTRVSPTVSRAGTKELFTLMVKILKITNLKTLRNHLPTGSFDKMDDYTN